MKKGLFYFIQSLFTVFTLLMLISCTQQTSKTDEKKLNSINTKTINISKPASSFEDTLIIRKLSVVIYYPDSLQLEKIRTITDTNVYKSSIHEFTYQIHNAQLVLEKTWPKLRIIESKKNRYLQFIKRDGTTDLIDLNTKNDAYGLFIFDTKKSPVLIDMTNLETDISFYLKN